MKKITKDIVAKLFTASPLVTIVVVILVFLLGLFYWFQIRPAEARKNCIKQQAGATRFLGKRVSFDENKFEACMLLQGIKP